jgi:hypothetical protein
LEDFDETWYKERPHCVGIHIVRRALFKFSRSNGQMGPGLGISFEKYFVFASPPKRFGGF